MCQFLFAPDTTTKLSFNSPILQLLMRTVPKCVSQPGLGQSRGLQESLGPLDAGQPGGDPVGDREDGFEVLCHFVPLKSFIFISTYCDNGGLPDIAVPLGDAGENDDLAFLGCFSQNGTHETQPFRVRITQRIVQDERRSTILGDDH